jgi:superfamily II DNA helicase RecQ
LLFQDPAVVEKTGAQLEYLVACIDCRDDIQVILPTGGGKSAGWLVPAVLDPRRVSVVVTPYTLVLEDQLRSAGERGIVAERFTANLEKPRLREDVQIIFVQPETVASLAFRE